MVKFINEVTREFGITHHILRAWEDKGFLGEVQRDFTYGRMYTEDQLERIKAIQEVVKGQQEKGLKRTDFTEVERVLLDKFGGLVKVQENIPATPETFTNMLLKMENQDRQIRELHQMISQLTQVTKELPVPANHSAEIEAIKKSTEGIMTKEQAEQLILKIADEEKQKKEMKNEIKLLKDKLDIAVEYIQQQETRKTEKRGIFRKIFG